MGGANVCRWRAKVRNGGAPMCVGGGRRCVRVVAAAGKTKLMHSLFPIRSVFSHFSETNRKVHQ